MVLAGREKATIFLSILGAETSTRVLRYLPEEIADLIAAGINHLPTPSPEALAEVIDEFESFLALPEPEINQPAAVPPTSKKPFASLIYERPQITAFILSLLSMEERLEALHALGRERGLVEELLNNLKPTPLQEKIAEKVRQNFAGRIF